MVVLNRILNNLQFYLVSGFAVPVSILSDYGAVFFALLGRMCEWLVGVCVRWLSGACVWLVGEDMAKMGSGSREMVRMDSVLRGNDSGNPDEKRWDAGMLDIEHGIMNCAVITPKSRCTSGGAKRLQKVQGCRYAPQLKNLCWVV